MSILAVHCATKRFGRHTAVDALSFQLERGELCGFLGPNGAGKTTTIGMITGLIRPTSGEIELFDEKPPKRLAAHRRMGCLIEAPAFYGHLSARRNLELFARAHGRGAVQRIPGALDQAGLGRWSDASVRKFSQGMKQRLGIARALLNDPELLLLDEPTTGLDPEGTEEVWDLLRRLVVESDRTVLVSSHLLHEIESHCHSAIVIDRGKRLAQGPVDGLLEMSDVAGYVLDVALESAEKAWRIAEQVARGAAEAPDEREKSMIARREPNCLLLRTNDDEVRRLLVQKLSEEGIAIERLVRLRPTLKELFLDLTGRVVRESSE